MEDLCRRAERGEVGRSEFLTPRLCHYGTLYLERRGVEYLTYGGYPEAERKRIYLLPDYMTDEESPMTVERLEEFDCSLELVAVQATGSGYRSLSHRDFLGSLLGLGLERSVFGDLIVTEEGRTAVVFCEERIVPFLLREWTKVATDSVKVSVLPLTDGIVAPQRYEPIGATVASPRLDATVAALCRLSREKARELILGGMVEMNFESEERPDRTVTAPAQISVRGYGRYRVLALSDLTKKGRIRMEAERYR